MAKTNKSKISSASLLENPENKKFSGSSLQGCSFR